MTMKNPLDNNDLNNRNLPPCTEQSMPPRLNPSLYSDRETQEMSPSTVSLCDSKASKRSRGVEIFVGDVSFFCVDYDIFQLFSQFGRVLRARIKKSDKDGRTLMYGFVDMENVHEAEKAVAQLHGSRFQGRDIR
jgi:RNA recognition motif-containing protein